jgi:hypothetical protein
MRLSIDARGAGVLARARNAGPVAGCTPRVLVRFAHCAPRGGPTSATRYRCKRGHSRDELIGGSATEFGA